MLDNIRKHSLTVTHVALSITRMVVSRSPRIFTYDPVPTIQAAALLHDLAKTYCIHHRGNHAQIGAAWVMALTRNPAIGHAVLHHISWPGTIDVSNHFIPLVVAYSDKRVRHHKVVALKERMEDLMIRYGSTDHQRAAIRTTFEQVRTIEHQLEQLTGVPLHAHPFDSRRLVQ